MNYKDFLVECSEPCSFDKTIMPLGAFLFDGGNKGSYPKTPEGYYTMRVFGDAEFIKFAITNQGYGKVIKEVIPLQNQDLLSQEQKELKQ